MKVRLVHVPGDPLIPFQIHALEPWEDQHTHELTAYLAGFPSEESRLVYMVHHDELQPV